MVNKIRKLLTWLDGHFEETLLMAFLAAIAVVELMQVIIRKLPFVPALTWAEEFCRFMWIWSVFISLPYTIKTGTMLRVTALSDILPQRGAELLDITVQAAVLAAMLVCAASSAPVVMGIAKSGETSPAMLWPMWTVYSFVLLGFALACIRSAQSLKEKIKKRKER